MDPLTDDRPVRWGILATGKIAHAFAHDLALVPGAEVVAVGSRRAAAAEQFAADMTGGRARAHGSYEALVADPAVDVVYVATPHALHLDNVRMALEAGKHVLCEKPVALTLADAEEMVRLSAEHDRFLMEAMWTACHPVIRQLRTQLAEGRFGAPRQLQAELGFRVDAPPEDRLMNPDLGGGALLDMGVYPLTFAHLMLGEAEVLSAVGSLAETGIDLDVAIAGRYAGGALATMNASISSWSSRAAAIATDLGRIVITDQFHHPKEAVFHPFGGGGDDSTELGEPVVVRGEEPTIGLGYGNEIAEVGRCLRAGLRESPLVPHAQTLTILRQMDELRRQIGVRYSGEG